MDRLFPLLLGAVLASSAAYGQSPTLYITSSHCLNDSSDPLLLWLPGLQPVPIEIQADAPQGARGFEFSIPGFTEAAGILVMDLVPNPEASSAEGNPFAEGARIVFPTCQSAPVTLYRGTLFVLGSNTSVRWTVAPHHSPLDPGTLCPTAGACGEEGASCLLAAPAQEFAAPPHDPDPADGATNVPLDTTLLFDWKSGSCTCLGVPCIVLYFGVEPDPPVFFSLCDTPFPDLELKPSTTYYWRVSADYCGYVIGPVWSFTTAPPIGVEAVTWSNVKQIFR